eukprot:scaffold106721_cov20-Tisochrysis_lutea.AAC.4
MAQQWREFKHLLHREEEAEEAAGTTGEDFLCCCMQKVGCWMELLPFAHQGMTNRKELEQPPSNP